ncbi:MAG: thiamine pyrophosphate-binding protein, partial [Thermomicrobiales bacterium]
MFPTCYSRGIETRPSSTHGPSLIHSRKELGMQGARALVEVLRRSGVEHIFGLPGDTGMAFYEALNDAQNDITHIMTRDERSASFM